MGVAPPAYQTHPDQSTYPHDPSSYSQQSHQQQAHSPSNYSEHPEVLMQPQHTYNSASPLPQKQDSHPPAINHQASQPPTMAHEASNPPTTAHQASYQTQQPMGQPSPVPLASLMTSPNWAQCPSCNHIQMTRVEFVSGTTTHLWAAGLCCLTGLGCIPYCVSGLKNVEHHCGQCGNLLAIHKRGSGTEVYAGPGAVQQTPPKKEKPAKK